MPDDEQRLVELLILFCQPGKHKVEVYFDRAPVGQAGVSQPRAGAGSFCVRTSHRLTMPSASACASLGKSARTWVVVSSDRSVQAAAREVHAQVLSSE